MTDRFIVGFFGKAGSGKSFKIQQILDYFPKPVFILDTQNEFDEGLQFDDAEVLRVFLVEGYANASGIYVLNSTTDQDFDKFFRILSAGQFPATIVIDEADLFCTPYNINDDLNRIIKYGRHWSQNIVYAARRPAEVNRNLTAQSDCLVSFKQTEPRDIASLKRSYAQADELSDLDETKYEFMILGRCDHLPFGMILSEGALTNTIPIRTIKYEEPEEPESEILDPQQTDESIL